MLTKYLRSVVFSAAILLLLTTSVISASCTSQTAQPSTTPDINSLPPPQATEPAAQQSPSTIEVELKYDDGTERDCASAVGGYLVDFLPPYIPFTIKKVRMMGAIYGKPVASEFEVEIWDKDKNVVYNNNYPVSKFKTDSPDWVEIEIPDIEVMDEFYIHVWTGTARLQGIHLGADDSVINTHSTITFKSAGIAQESEIWTYRPESWLYDKSKVNWMIRVGGAYLSSSLALPPKQTPKLPVPMTTPILVESIQKELLPHIRDNNKKVEVFWTKPKSGGPYPAVLLIHGHQEDIRNGGEMYVESGMLQFLAQQGWIAAAVSQPGYGNSNGPLDYCGPFTQEAVAVAIDFLRKQDSIKPDKIAIYGYSRGAIVASMVATQDLKLAAVVLGAGAYDFSKFYATTLPGIAYNIRVEAGTSYEAFKARSAILYPEKIKAPVLLLHGAKDDRIQVQQAENFAEKLEANGVTVKLVIFPDAPHGIPLQLQYREVLPFLRQSLDLP